MISNPIPGPHEPAPPEPAAYLVPRMGKLVPDKPKPVRLVTEIDLEEIQGWLIPRLQDGHKHLNPDAVLSWLRATMVDRSSMLVRTKNMVGLVEFRRSPLSPIGIVTEIFVRSRAKRDEEAVLLYVALRDWASAAGAEEFRFNIDSDAAMSHVISAMFADNRALGPRRSAIYITTLRR